MTQREWNTCTHPATILAFLQSVGRLNERKVRLFLVACCRRFAKSRDQDTADAVEVAERFADGRATSERLQHAYAVVSQLYLRVPAPGYLAGSFACGELSATTSAAEVARVAASLARLSVVSRGSLFAEEVELHAQAALLRELFGNPFRSPPPLAASVMTWNGDCVLKLATAIYEERQYAPERMGILADALEEAACDNEEVLSHCRQEGAVHVRGCWCVDLLLGKS